MECHAWRVENFLPTTTVVEFKLFDSIYPPTPTGAYLAESRQKHKVIYLLNRGIKPVLYAIVS